MKLAPVTSITSKRQPLSKLEKATIIANLPSYVDVNLESIPDYNDEGKIEKSRFKEELVKRYEDENAIFICFAFIRLNKVNHNQNFGFRSDGVDQADVASIREDMDCNGFVDDIPGAPPPIWNCNTELLVDGHHRFEAIKSLHLFGKKIPEYMPIAVFHFHDSSEYAVGEFGQGIHIERKVRNDWKITDTIDLLVNKLHLIAQEKGIKVQDFTLDQVTQFFESGTLCKKIKAKQTKTKIANGAYEIIKMGGERDVYSQSGEKWETWSPDALDRRSSTSIPNHFRSILNLNLSHIEGTFWYRYICEKSRRRVMRIGFHADFTDPKRIAREIFSSLKKFEEMNEYCARVWEDRGKITFGNGAITINTIDNKIDRVRPDQIEIMGIVPLLQKKTKKQRVNKEWVGIVEYCELVGYKLNKEEKRLIELFDIKD